MMQSMHQVASSASTRLSSLLMGVRPRSAISNGLHPNDSADPLLLGNMGSSSELHRTSSADMSSGPNSKSSGIGSGLGLGLSRPIQRLILVFIVPIALFLTFRSLHGGNTNGAAHPQAGYHVSQWSSGSGLLSKLSGGGWGSYEVSERDVDPLRLPGWLEGTKWVNADKDVQIHHWLDRLSTKEDGPDLDWARDKTVLVLGDSVVRDWVWRLCDNHLHHPKDSVWFDENVRNEKTSGWECVAPQTKTRFINGFIYGMTNYSRHSPPDQPRSPLLSGEWPPGPWGYEDRIPELVKQYSQYKPDMVVLNSGAWDFKFMFRRDVYEGNAAVDIDPFELHEYGERLRECFRMLRAAFPTQKLLFLQMHPFGSDDAAAKWFWGKALSGGHNYGIDFSPPDVDQEAVKKLPHLFSRRRVGQLASTYRTVVEQEGWDELDYWKISQAFDEGKFIRPGDSIHPADPSIAVMLDWALEKLYRWSTYGV